VRSLLLALALVLALRLPFLDHPMQGDDFYYLAAGQHAQVDPLHPHRARYVFLGQWVDMRGHPHPPGNAWFLAALLATPGDAGEIPFHAAYLLFSVVAVVAMWDLARRFSPCPLWATLLFLSTPAFLVSGTSLEADLPLVALWLAATALWVRAVERRSPVALAASAACLALAAMVAYQAVVLVPILAWFLRRSVPRWRPAWPVLATPIVVVIAWQLFERLTGGPFPASVLAGYFETYGLQTFSNKLSNAGALVAHTGWILFPPLAVAAFRGRGRWFWIAVAATAALAACVDSHPLFWGSFIVGLVALSWCCVRIRAASNAEPRPEGAVIHDESFLTAWVVMFFAAALVLFFAGAARYLLPIAAPLALLATRRFGARRRWWMAAGLACQLLVSVGLMAANQQHWDGYRRFVLSLDKAFSSRRVWINGEWGMRHYAESLGGLPIELGQAVGPGDVVLSSRLAFPVHFTTGGGVATPLAEREIRPALPFRLLALGARSAWSTNSFGLRPFDLGWAPVDVVRADLILPRRPALVHLPMNAPEAETQIVSGVYGLEAGAWRWMSGRAVLLLKRPVERLPLSVAFHIPAHAPARRVTLWLDGIKVAEGSYSGSGNYSLVAQPAHAAAETATVAITVDRVFRSPGDQRELGIILLSAGFK